VFEKNARLVRLMFKKKLYIYIDNNNIENKKLVTGTLSFVTTRLNRTRLMVDVTTRAVIMFSSIVTNWSTGNVCPRSLSPIDGARRRGLGRYYRSVRREGGVILGPVVFVSHHATSKQFGYSGFWNKKKNDVLFFLSGIRLTGFIDNNATINATRFVRRVCVCSGVAKE